MSMKWVGGLNHKTHYDSYSYTQDPGNSLKVPESRYWGRAASL